MVASGLVLVSRIKSYESFQNIKMDRCNHLHVGAPSINERVPRDIKQPGQDHYWSYKVVLQKSVSLQTHCRRFLCEKFYQSMKLIDFGSNVLRQQLGFVTKAASF